MISTDDAERYAKTRLAELTRHVAACMTPTTLGAMVDDFGNHPPHPMPADLPAFFAAMERQREVLGV